MQRGAPSIRKGLMQEVVMAGNMSEGRFGIIF